MTGHVLSLCTRHTALCCVRLAVAMTEHARMSLEKVIRSAGDRGPDLESQLQWLRGGARAEQRPFICQ